MWCPYLEDGAALKGCSLQNQETEMSKSIKAILAVGLVALVAACGQQEEEVVMVEPEPIMAEPTMSKF